MEHWKKNSLDENEEQTHKAMPLEGVLKKDEIVDCLSFRLRFFFSL